MMRLKYLRDDLLNTCPTCTRLIFKSNITANRGKLNSYHLLDGIIHLVVVIEGPDLPEDRK
jgi:hypothetical protein